MPVVGAAGVVEQGPEGVVEIEGVAVPPRDGGGGGDVLTGRRVASLDTAVRGVDRRRWRGEDRSVGAGVGDRGVGPELDAHCAFVDGAVVEPAELDQVVERRGPAMRKVTDVVALHDPRLET